jgi:hypothetical protein
MQRVEDNELLLSCYSNTIKASSFEKGAFKMEQIFQMLNDLISTILSLNHLDPYLSRNFTPDLIPFFSFVCGKKMWSYKGMYGGYI